MPGDTRMNTMFKLVHRAVELKSVLESLVTDPHYSTMAQATMRAHNSKCVESSKVPVKPDGTLLDRVKDNVLGKTMWEDAALFLKASRTCMYFHRLVDTGAPTLGKVYYYSAMVATHLAVLRQGSPMVAAMETIFKTRWARWYSMASTDTYLSICSGPIVS